MCGKQKRKPKCRRPRWSVGLGLAGSRLPVDGQWTLSVFLQSARKKGSRSSAALRIPTVANGLDRFCSTRQSSPAQPEQTDHRPKAKAVICIGKQKNMQFICRVAGSHHIHVGRERDRGVEGVVCVQVSLRSASSPSSERVCVCVFMDCMVFFHSLSLYLLPRRRTHTRA